MKETGASPTTEAEFERLAESLGFQVNYLARLLKSELEYRLRPYNLSPTIWTVLVAMLEEDGLSQRDVAARAGLDNATMTRALDVLEARDFINRNRDGDDRRVQIISLTEEGRKIATETARVGEEINRAAVELLTPNECRQVPELIRRLTLKMESLAEGKTP